MRIMNVQGIPGLVLALFCCCRQAEADRQLEEQREKAARAMKAVQRAQKLLATQASMAGGKAEGSSSARGSSSEVVAELEQDIQLAEARLVTRTMLQELRTLAQQHPGECEQALTRSFILLLS